MVRPEFVVDTRNTLQRGVDCYIRSHFPNMFTVSSCCVMLCACISDIRIIIVMCSDVQENLYKMNKQLDFWQKTLSEALSDGDDEGIKRARLMTRLKLVKQQGLKEEFAVLQVECRVQRGWELGIFS